MITQLFQIGIKSKKLTTTLKFKRQGLANGASLLVLHGWGMNSSAWQMITKDLEQLFQVTWVDLPGHGNNHDVVADNLSDIVSLIFPLITQPTHIMGWSLGGLIAQEVIHQRPQLIKRVIMIASTPRFSQSKHWHHAMPNKLLSAFSKGLIKDLNGTIKRFIALQFIGVKESKSLQQELIASIFQSLPNQKSLQVGLKILQQQDFLNLKMTQQQLWLFGGKDRLIPIEMKNDLSILYPSAIIAEIAEAGHAPFMTHPQEFMHIIKHFLVQNTRLQGK